MRQRGMKWGRRQSGIKRGRKEGLFTKQEEQREEKKNKQGRN